jgi:Cdc6-like AAA superfamily ATPase
MLIFQGMARCGFPPYTHEELSTIVRNALGNEKSSRLNEALMLLSRKVAAISGNFHVVERHTIFLTLIESAGDARRALEIAKRTLEIIQAKDEEIGMSSASAVVAVGEAFKELFSSPKIEAVK